MFPTATRFVVPLINKIIQVFASHRVALVGGQSHEFKDYTMCHILPVLQKVLKVQPHIFAADRNYSFRRELCLFSFAALMSFVSCNIDLITLVHHYAAIVSVRE